MKKPIKIYFLCVHNRCRSQMAEAFTRLYGGSNVVVESAGIEEASHVHPLAVEVMREVGRDISNNVPKLINMKSFVSSSIVIKLCQEAMERCPAIPFGVHHEDWNIPDPISTNGDIEVFRRVRDEIDDRVKALLQELDAFEIDLDF